MISLVKVARLHLVDRFGYTWLVWGVLTLTFVINLAIFAVVPLTQPSGNFTGALVTIYLFVVVIGLQAATRFLPFALTLGVSRRTYYLGTVLLIVPLCTLYASILTVLWAVEGATNGWGPQVHYFRVPWILDGPWYQVLVTNGVLLALVLLFGLWCGLIYRRFGPDRHPGVPRAVVDPGGRRGAAGHLAAVVAGGRRLPVRPECPCRQWDAGAGGGRDRRRRLSDHPADHGLSKHGERARRGPSTPRRAPSSLKLFER